MREASQVIDRVRSLETQDLFGWRREILIAHGLSYEDAEEWRSDTALKEYWQDPDDERTLKAATRYLEFAVPRALVHRLQISVRSLDRMVEFAWLLGRDDVATKMDGGPFNQFGTPGLYLFAHTFGLEDAWVKWDSVSDGRLNRMARSLVCEPGCRQCIEEET